MRKKEAPKSTLGVMALSCTGSKEDFVDKVKCDLTTFVGTPSADRVLVFPPVNSFYRFLIHQLAQDTFDQLRTFSIGEDPDRRIVVCTKDLIARVDGVKDEPAASVTTDSGASKLTMVISDTEKSSRVQIRKSRSSLPTIGIYRPPAARKSVEDACRLQNSPASDTVVLASSTKNATTPTASRTRVRRPDLQVYVPRAKRGFQESEQFDDGSTVPVDDQSTSRSPTCLPSDSLPREKFKQNSSLIIDVKNCLKEKPSSPNGTTSSLTARASQLVETKKKLCQSTSSDLDLEGINCAAPVGNDRILSAMSSGQQVCLPTRAEVLVEKKKKLFLTDEVEGEISSVIDCKVTNLNSVSDKRGNCDIVQVEDKPQIKNISDSATEAKTFKNSSLLKVECDTSSTPQILQRTDSSDEEYQEAPGGEKSNGLHTFSDRHSGGGSSESLSSNDSINAHVSPVQLMKPIKTESSKKPSSKPTRVFNPDECDWDALLDEDGDVLDSFLMKELTSAVGEVKIVQPKSDYRVYRSQLPAEQQRTRRSAGDEDFSHVVEIFSFPPEFKTNDLVAVLAPFKNTAGGFEIKWVDDTHALGVFGSTLVAEQVLAYQHPMVRMRPLCEATLESRLKARRLADSIQSFRPRPETCAALARRLVTGALGVKLPTARQEREEERRVLREAREKRRLAVQQQDDIWNS